MGDQSSKKRKRYYTIGEVAEQLDVSNSLIRYWEKEFDIIRPRKTRKGDRLFTPKDIDKLEMIYHLTREKGYKLKGAKKKLKYNRTETEKEFAIIQSLKKVRHFLEELRENLD
jgi:DNA-binding transcriptional MerR regulator